MKKIIFAFLILFLNVFSHAQDTLEVFVMLVEFQEEKPDNSLTTGTGKFNSDKKHSYKLDPSGARANANYWLRHFDFVNSYFKAASNGKIVIKPRIFPEETLYTLDKQIISYVRTGKSKKEKTAEYDEDCNRLYLNFIYDAVAKAHKSENSPFNIALSKNNKRAFMIVHAGANRLVDGGSMGTKNADTPGDFMDAFISRDAWMYLQPDSAKVNGITPALGVNADGDSVVTGLVLKGATIDTLRSVMVVSETASQDGLNWGINGILVNQIGRELGLPNTYDVVKGISRLGYYDVMDFAGYSAGNGFLPSLPSAWNRAYMGWSQVKEVRPTSGHPVTVDIAAAGSGLGTEIVKVPLNGNEYLLIENRQRSLNKEGTISVKSVQDANDNSDIIETVKSVKKISEIFEDSICVKGKCTSKKLSGFITALSSHDAGIPASGIAVWKVNDWHIREALSSDAINFWSGDTFRDHQYGISLIEADGILSIGKTFKNAIGEDTYDFGSGTDLLPHLRVPMSSSSSSFKVVNSINPSGYANTATTQGGYTGIKITVNVPKDARKEKTANLFMGDSVVNYASPIISVTISIDDGSIEESKFPKNVGLNSAVRGAVFIDYPNGNTNEKAVVFASEDGTIQVMSALGDSLFASDTTLVQKAISKNDTSKKISLYRVGPSFGEFVGMASNGKTVYSLHKNKLVKIDFTSGMYPFYIEKDVDFAIAGPIVVNSDVWYADKNGLNGIFEKELPEHDGLSGDTRKITDDEISDFAYCGKENAFFALATKKGEVHFNAIKQDLKANDKSFRIACTDIDRDGEEEIIVVGSRGTVALLKPSVKNSTLVWKHNYKRGLAGSSGLKDETSGIAIGDINGDKYPEIVMLGDNLVYALDRYGIPLANFPVTLSRSLPVVGFMSDPLLVDVTGDSIPEILIPSSDGLIYAYTGRGKPATKQFPLAAGNFEYLDEQSTIYPMSIYVSNAVSDEKSKGPEIYAFHRNFVNAFRLVKAENNAEIASAAWALPAGGNERRGYFDASALGKIEEIKQKDEIREFFVFPNPIRGGKAQARFELGAQAKSVTLEFFDITGLCVYKKNITNVIAGKNQTEELDLRQLGSDVYTVRLKVNFIDGKSKQKLYRVGVIK